MTDQPTHDDYTPPYGLGGEPSVPDPRDFEATLDTAFKLPDRFLLTGIPTALNQHDTPKCGGYSGAGLKAVQERADTGKFLAFDGDWLYARAQAYDGIAQPHIGTTARGVCKALQKEGCQVRGKPGIAARYRITSYASVPQTFEGIRRALFTYRTPILLGSSWYRSWFDPVKGVLPAPDRHEGGHLFFAWGWDVNVADEHGGSVLCQNSWGQYAGSVHGRFYSPTDYLIPALHDAWVLLDKEGSKP